MTKDAPAFDFYAERWTHGTRHMTKVERCDYMDLLAHQWTNDGLPADLNIVARLIGYKKASQIPALVLEKFPVAEDGKRRNRRLEEERAKQRERIARKSQASKRANAVRWGNAVTDKSHTDPSATPVGSFRESQNDPHLPPPTSHPKGTPIIPQGGKAEEDQALKNQASQPSATIPPWTRAPPRHGRRPRSSGRWRAGSSARPPRPGAGRR